MNNLIRVLVFLTFFVSLSVYAQEEEFSDEFENEKVENVDNTTQKNDEFAEDDEFSGDDEFSDGDEFSDDGGEFDEFSETDEAEEAPKTNWNRFYWAAGILFFTMLAGFFVRHKKLRKLRPLFLLGAVVILGFYRGGPGIISSFQNTYLFAIGATAKWTAMVLFLGVIVLTYFFGKVFCGWTCYLGAIQEFLHIRKLEILYTEKAQKIMRIIRYVILGILLLQLTITQGIEWSKIGPFKVIFNLYSPNLTGYILLGILLISSLFIHRPFC